MPDVTTTIPARGMRQRLAKSRSNGISPVAGLSEREFEILHFIGLGFGTRQIAEKLNRSVKTIEAHRANLKEKLQLKIARSPLSVRAQFRLSPSAVSQDAG